MARFEGCDQLAGEFQTQENVARPNEDWQANPCDRSSDPERMQMPANAAATVHPVGHSGTGSSESRCNKLYYKNLHHLTLRGQYCRDRPGVMHENGEVIVTFIMHWLHIC